MEIPCQYKLAFQITSMCDVLIILIFRIAKDRKIISRNFRFYRTVVRFQCAFGLLLVKLLICLCFSSYFSSPCLIASSSVAKLCHLSLAFLSLNISLKCALFCVSFCSSLPPISLNAFTYPSVDNLQRSRKSCCPLARVVSHILWT